MSVRPIVLTVAGLDPSGGAGVVADIRTIAAFDCFPVAAITSITFQNTRTVFGARHQTAETVRAQIEPVMKDLAIAAMKTGMLPTVEIIQVVAKLCRSGALPAPVIDPVMISTSGQPLLEEAAIEALQKKLLPLARIVTPNIPEAERLSGVSIKSEQSMRQAAQRISELGAHAVLVKGGHRRVERNEAVDLLLDESGVFTEYRAEYVEVGEIHGSGCTLSAAIAACLARDMTLPQAVQTAKDFVTNAIRESEAMGHGARPLFGACKPSP